MTTPRETPQNEVFLMQQCASVYHEMTGFKKSDEMFAPLATPSEWKKQTVFSYARVQELGISFLTKVFFCVKI